MKNLFENFRNFVNEKTRDTYGSEVVDRNKATFKNALVEKEEDEQSKDSEIKKKIKVVLKREGGAAGFDPLLKAARKIDPKISEEEVKQIISAMSDVEQHADTDYIDVSGLKEAVGIFLEMKEDTLDEKRKRKKKSKKKKGKKDACYHKVRARYSVWPSAYASGALVKCRKAGASNWGTGGKKKKKRKNESLSLEDMIREEIQSVLDEKERSCWKWYKKNPDPEGPKTGPGSCVPAEESLSKDELEEKKKRKKKRKLTAKPSSETSLRDWFGRKGAKGKKSGWVDCNTCRKNKKTGRKTCSACGRSGGEKRAKYPSCRPTPAACGKRGKYGKKSKAGKKG